MLYIILIIVLLLKITNFGNISCGINGNAQIKFIEKIKINYSMN